MKGKNQESDLEKTREKEFKKYQSKIITVSNASAYGGCVSGWKAFCDANGISWRRAVRQGLTVSELLATKDAVAEDICRFTITGVKKL